MSGEEESICQLKVSLGKGVEEGDEGQERRAYIEDI